MAITKEQFTWLYINASCLAEVALVELAIEGGVARDSSEPASRSSGAAIDLAAVDDWIGDSGGEFDLEALLKAESNLLGCHEAANVEQPVEDHGSARAAEQSGDSSDKADDRQTYLARAYDDFEAWGEIITEAEIAGRTAKIEHLLSGLPTDWSGLCVRLTVEEFEMWLGLYKSQDEAIARLVAEMRSLSQ